MTFPKDFIWGAATSAYQFEGAAGDDGRGPSIWDEFCRRPGTVRQGASGATSCDHYYRYLQDVGLMQGLGLQAYRFSISWPRVLPSGMGQVNVAGLDFYDRLTDALLAAGITPYATLYHWDYPLALHRFGGWLHPESSDWFARYAEVIVDRLSDRIRHWITLNEPQIFVGMGYQDGSHAPGESLELSKILMIGHNVLLAHGKAVQAIRSRAKAKPAVGYAVAVSPVAVPATEAGADIQAAREVFFSASRPFSINNSWWTDPVVLGRYPQDGLRLFEKALPRIGGNDLATVCQPLDFLGLNVYFGELYRAGDGGAPERVPFAPDHEKTSFDWPVVPESLYWASKFYAERYGLPIIIAENGMAGADAVSPDGSVHDARRIDFFRRYLSQLKRAISEGMDVRGYFVWSLLDNFEWTEGYTQRFGIVYVDYPTQQRIVKDSATWYKEVIAANGATV
jgi:beta-glucosidase